MRNFSRIVTTIQWFGKWQFKTNGGVTTLPSLFLGLGGVLPSAFKESPSSSWIEWLYQRLGMKSGIVPCVANCGAYYTPAPLVSTLVGYDPACGTGDFLLFAQATLQERASLA